MNTLSPEYNINNANKILNNFLRHHIQQTHEYEEILWNLLDSLLRREEDDDNLYHLLEKLNPNECLFHSCEKKPFKFRNVNFRLCIDHFNLANTRYKKIVKSKTDPLNEFTKYMIKHKEPFDINKLTYRQTERLFIRIIEHLRTHYLYYIKQYNEIKKKFENNNKYKYPITHIYQIKKPVFSPSSKKQKKCTNDTNGTCQTKQLTYPCFHNTCTILQTQYKTQKYLLKNKEKYYLAMNNNVNEFHRKAIEYGISPPIVEETEHHVIFEFDIDCLPLYKIRENVLFNLDCLFDFVEPDEQLQDLFLTKNQFNEFWNDETQARFWSDTHFELKVYLFCIFQSNIIKLILKTLEPLHNEGIYHTNLNQYNIFINNDNKLFIFDFDHAEKTEKTKSEFKKHQFINRLFHGSSIDTLKNNGYTNKVNQYFDILDKTKFLEWNEETINNCFKRYLDLDNVEDDVMSFIKSLHF